MLVIGTAGITFVPEDPEIQLMRCQRYYELGSNFGVLVYSSAGDPLSLISITFKTPKSGTPTVNLSNGTTLNSLAPTVTAVNEAGFSIFLAAAGAGTNGLGNAHPPDASWTAAV
jgi:hypothetical protein